MRAREKQMLALLAIGGMVLAASGGGSQSGGGENPGPMFEPPNFSPEQWEALGDTLVNEVRQYMKLPNLSPMAIMAAGLNVAEKREKVTLDNPSAFLSAILDALEGADAGRFRVTLGKLREWARMLWQLEPFIERIAEYVNAPVVEPDAETDAEKPSGIDFVEVDEKTGAWYDAIDRLLSEAGFYGTPIGQLIDYAKTAAKEQGAKDTDPSWWAIVSDPDDNAIEFFNKAIDWHINRGKDLAGWLARSVSLFVADQGGGDGPCDQKLPAFDAIVPSWEDLDDEYKDPDFMEVPKVQTLLADTADLYRKAVVRLLWDTWREVALLGVDDCSFYTKAELTEAAQAVLPGLNVGMQPGQIHPLTVRMALELYKAMYPESFPANKNFITPQLIAVGATLSF